MPLPLSSPSISSMPQGTIPEPDKPPVRTKRRYGASCELCRRRKRKCPGRDSTGKSLCTHCSEVGVKCVFPPNGKNMRVPKPLPTTSESSNTEVNALRKYIRRLAVTDQEERDRMLSEWLKEDGVNQLVLSSTTPGLRHKSRDQSSVASEDEGFDSPSTRMDDNDLDRARAPKRMRTSEERRSRSPSADESGDQDDTQWRPESALRLSLKPATPADSENSSVADGEHGRPAPPVSTWVDHYVSQSFLNSPEGESPTHDEMATLLDNYFCWQGPRNSIVDEKIFKNAMRENDPKYFNTFLLYSIYAHTIRYVPHLAEKVHEYTAKTHLLLAGALSRPSSIPTVQGILLLAANHAARGMYAQAWCLTASAIGMIIDLECHLDKGTPDEKPHDRAYIQRQMRLRVFWAAYNWDKMLSLALNRTPLLNLEDHYPALPDPKAEDELWEPVLSHDSPPPLRQYYPQLCREAKCFYETCKANQFLDEVHRNLYRKKMRPHLVQQFIEHMRGKLLEWRDKADRDIIRDFDRNSVPPPPHILQLNLLVQLIWILLYRPFYYTSFRDPSRAVPHAVPTCERAAAKIGDLFFLYDSYYPLGRASYLVIFAAFLAATVDLALVNRQRSVPAAILNRLELARRVLEGGSDNIPGMQSSVASLQRHLVETMNRYNIHSDMQVDEGSPTITNSSSPSSVPTPVATKQETPTPPSTIGHNSHSSQSASPEALPQPIPHTARSSIHQMASYPPHRSHDHSRGTSNENHYPPARPYHVNHYQPSGGQPKHEPGYGPLPPQPEQEHSSYPYPSSAVPQISLIDPTTSYHASRMPQEQQLQQQHIQTYSSSPGGDPYTQHARRNSTVSDNSQHFTPISPQAANAGAQGMHEYPPIHSYEHPYNNTWFFDDNFQYQPAHAWQNST